MATTETTVSAQAHAASFSSKLRTIALIIVAFAFVMDLLDTTIVNIAIPTIQTNLTASYSSIQWIVAGYSLTFALLLVTGGRMGDVFGYKKLFLIGVAGFTVASLLNGVSVNAGMLITSRLIQGCFSALMVPQVMSLMQVMYKPSERGSINGLFGALGGLSASLGPVIGGLLLKWNVAGLEWRPLFLINIPVGLFAFAMGVKYLPDGKSPHPLKLDFVGTGIIVLAMLLIVYPLIQGREYGWPTWSFAMLGAALPILAVFVYWQRRKEKTDGSPLVLPSLFRNRSFSVGLMLNLLFELAMVGFFLTNTLVLQIGFGFSPIHAALTGLPVAIAIAFTMALAGEKLIPKLGRRAFFISAVCMAVGIYLVSLTVQHYGLGVHSWQLIPGLAIFGIGMGFGFGSLFAAVLNGVDPGHAGSASGTLNAIQQVGGAIGIAVVGVIFFGQLSSAAPQSFAKIEPQLTQQLTAAHVPAAAQAQIVSGAKACYVDRAKSKDPSVVPAACQQLSSSNTANSPIGKQIEADILGANAQNFSHAFRAAAIYSAIVLAVVFCLGFLLPKRFKAEAYSEAVA
jgi:EmrB/QacA subfamily drug resistance transporter